MRSYITDRQRAIKNNILMQFQEIKTFLKKSFDDDLEKAKPGDTRMGADGHMREWKEYQPGKWDWRKVKGGGSGSAATGSTTSGAASKPTSSPHKIDWDNPTPEITKLIDFAKKSTKDVLLQYARKKGINPNLVAVARKVLTDDHGAKEEDFEYKKLSNDDPDVADDLKSKYAHLLFRDEEEQREDPVARVENYKSEIRHFVKQPNAHMFVYGSGGAGKTQAIEDTMEKLGQREFEIGKDKPGDKDYDWVKKGKVTLSTLMKALYEHNGKNIVFDDSDGILENRDAVNILKLAMDDKKARWVENDTTNKVMVSNPAYDPADPDTEEEPEIPMPKKFRFTGKVIFISNRPEEYFTENPDRQALLTRAKPISLDFTNKEMLQLIHRWLQDGGIKTPNLIQIPAKEAKKEAEEVFDVVKQVVHRVKPGKLNGRTIGALIGTKRRIEDDNEEIEQENKLRKVKGEKPLPLKQWDEEVVKELLRKGDEDTLEKGYDAEYEAELAYDLLVCNSRPKYNPSNSNGNVSNANNNLQKAYDTLGI
jgi:hypothetical protein